MPERSLIGIVARTAYWVEWWRRFGQPSGNEPKLTGPSGRYVIVTFIKGPNMGPYEAARHISGVSGHELSYVANKHVSIEQEKAMKFNALLTNAVIFHNALDIAEIVRQLLEEGWDRPGRAGAPTTTTRSSTSTSPRCATRT
ncbi:Tn3 family transposase [Streptomyces sp. NPDC058301]|uniref:Tn3 family transposase n=1 Tax=Streptomyces sp. NPDC058301 TaxID=3346436 RepID=UPI0036EED6F2